MGVETWITSDGRVYFVRLQQGRRLLTGGVSDDEESCLVRFDFFA